MDDVEEVVELVTSNPKLNSIEKETSINICGDSKQLRIFSAKATIVKSLLRNDHFEAEWIQGQKDGSLTKVERDQAATLDAIHSISGTAPVGLLTVKSKPRSQNNQSGIVNWKSVDPEAFE
jgi:spore germination protein GerM